MGVQLTGTWPLVGGGQVALFARPQGWLGVPDSFLRNYANLKPYGLTAGETLFVLQLMAFKWSSQAPFPSYKTLAKRMGITDKQARRYAQALEGKGYLRRTARIGGSNSFDLTALFEALNSALLNENKPAAA
jgi:hypothetical protein